MKTEEEYYKSLPRKRVSAGALIFKDDKLLVLELTYKDTLEIPGGVVEENESPLAAAGRECGEEIGVDVKIKRLLCMDYNHGDKTKGDATHFVFLGGQFPKERTTAPAGGSLAADERRAGQTGCKRRAGCQKRAGCLLRRRKTGLRRT